MELKKEPIELRKFLHQASGALQSAVTKRRQKLSIELPLGSLNFMADKVRLNQIINNLLSNASKYSPPGGRIKLSGAQEGSEIVFRCKDNGQGILPENLETIFEPFRRGRDTELGYGEASLGIGLALAKQLVELHGGTIQAASGGPGMGSEFTVRLPLVAAPTKSAASVEPALSPELRRSIVVVEDNPSTGSVMKIALGQAGYDVSLFSMVRPC